MSFQNQENLAQIKQREQEYSKLEQKYEELSNKLNCTKCETQEEISLKNQQLLAMQEQMESYQKDNLQIKEQTQELLEKVKKEQQEKEFLVDRRMINQFLVTYLNKNSNA